MHDECRLRSSRRNDNFWRNFGKSKFSLVIFHYDYWDIFMGLEWKNHDTLTIYNRCRRFYCFTYVWSVLRTCLQHVFIVSISKSKQIKWIKLLIKFDSILWSNIFIYLLAKFQCWIIILWQLKKSYYKHIFKYYSKHYYCLWMESTSFWKTWCGNCFKCYFGWRSGILI